MSAQVEDEHAAAGAQHPRRLAQHPRRVGGVVQRLRQQHDVEAAVGERQLLDVAALPGHVADPAPLGELARPRQHCRRAVHADHLAGPARRLEGQVAFAAADVGDVERRQQVAEGPRPGGPAAAGHELAPIPRVGAGMRVEVLAAETADFLDAGIVGAGLGGAGRSGEFRVEQLPQRVVAAAGPGQAVVGVDAVALLVDQAGVLEQPEVARHARLGQAEDAGELRHVEAVEAQRPQQPQPRRVAQHPETRRDRFDIHESIFDDMTFGQACHPSPGAGIGGRSAVAGCLRPAAAPVRASSSGGRRAGGKEREVH